MVNSLDIGGTEMIKCFGMGIHYKIKLVGHVPWEKDVMPLTRFKQFRAAFRPELGRTLVKDKCHQLRYIINRFNDRRKKITKYSVKF